MKEKGITLIALVVTVVVLLILASISIGVLTGNNGIINQAQKSKDESEISEEREIIDISVAQAVEKDKLGNFERDIFQEKLDDNTGNGVTETIDSGDTIVVKFIEKNRYYEVDKDGNVSGPIEIYEDDNSGDISKGGKQDGSEDYPFQISCIEDLVAFSIMANGGDTELGISSNWFEGKYIELTRTLDFNSIFSYDDYTTEKYGDLNEDGIIEGIKTELTKNDENCIGFTAIGVTSRGFRGFFDGNNNSIKNLYQKQTKTVGLFGSATDATIENITITGNITSTNYQAAAICAQANNTKIINCHNEANVIEEGKIDGVNPHIGGIIAVGNDNCEIINCSNIGDIRGDGPTGGIVGVLNGSIINCYNSGNITGGLGANYGAVGGIIGVNGASENEEDGLVVYNCFNTGEITSNDTSNYPYASAGGIMGSSGKNATNAKIINSYNIGKVNYTKRGYGGIVGGYWYNNVNIATLNNTYYQEDSDLLGYGNFSAAQGVEKKTQEYMHSEQLVTDLNNYIKNNTDGIDTSKWKTWKLGEDNYPVFDDNL